MKASRQVEECAILRRNYSKLSPCFCSAKTPKMTHFGPKKLHGFPVRTKICHIAPVSRIYIAGGGGGGGIQILPGKEASLLRGVDLGVCQKKNQKRTPAPLTLRSVRMLKFSHGHLPAAFPPKNDHAGTRSFFACGALERFRRVSETPTPAGLEESTAVHLQFVRQYAPHLYRWTFLASKP